MPVPLVTTPRSSAFRVASCCAVSVVDGVLAGFTDVISRGTTVCPATTDASTVAIVIGEARIWPWPIMSAAFSVSEAGGTTLPKYAGKPRSWSTPMPSVAAASTRSWSPSWSAR